MCNFSREAANLVEVLTSYEPSSGIRPTKDEGLHFLRIRPFPRRELSKFQHKRNYNSTRTLSLPPPRLRCSREV